MLLEIKDLTVTIDGKEIINGFNLSMKEGEVHAIMGPNGSGKSTLSYAIMGHPKYEVKGSVKLDGEELLELTADERAKKGLFLAFQAPQEISGVSIQNILRKAKLGGEEKKDLDKLIELQNQIKKKVKELQLPEESIKRDLNVGFSGGEKKRVEILQMSSLNPKLSILDEIDSGLDIDGVKTVAKSVNKLVDGKKSFLIITHYPRILNYIKPNFVHVMVNGKIVKSGDFKLAKELEKKGYGWLTSKKED
ncbi:Fe-S cluster assembly ATPase SufC [Candidatus Micrarchaeota archaeon]|nr:Fe-S cluster assembly ATPase SufC [Candidatus Micrarchaeota archaeon]